MAKNKKENAKSVAKAEVVQKPSVFAFHSYRAFLKASVDYASRGEGRSMRDLAKAMNLTPGFLSLILSGKRRPALEAIYKILEAFDLSRTERRGAVLLYQLEEAQLENVRREAFEELKDMREYRAQHPREVQAYEYLSKWYFVAIREMFQLPDFQFDAEWIRARLANKISIAEVDEALRFLVNGGLVIKKEDGRWSLGDQDLSCFDGIYKFSLASFYRQILGLASDSIEHITRDRRHLASHTVAISKNDFEKIRLIIEEALDRVQEVEKSSSHTSAEVFHISMVAFPLTNQDVGPLEKVDEKGSK